MLAFAVGFIITVAELELLRRGLESQQAGSAWMLAGGFAGGALVRGGTDRIVGHGFRRRAGGHARQQAWRIAASLLVVNLLEGLLGRNHGGRFRDPAGRPGAHESQLPGWRQWRQKQLHVGAATTTAAAAAAARQYRLVP